MSILEILKHEAPKRRVSARVQQQLEVFSPYFDEIKEAQERGYTWHQIGKAVERELVEKGEWLIGWGAFDVQRIFHLARKRAA